MGWNNSKTNNGRKFQYRRKKKSDTYAYSASNLSGTQPKLACGKSSNCRFDWIRNFRFFFPCFGFFSPLSKVWMSLSVSDRIFQCFSSHNVKKFWQYKRPWIENSEGFFVHSYIWASGAKGEWRVNSWLAISNTRKKIRDFFTCVVTAFLNAGNPRITQ